MDRDQALLSWQRQVWQWGCDFVPPNSNSELRTHLGAPPRYLLKIEYRIQRMIFGETRNSPSTKICCFFAKVFSPRQHVDHVGLGMVLVSIWVKTKKWAEKRGRRERRQWLSERIPAYVGRREKEEREDHRRHWFPLFVFFEKRCCWCWATIKHRYLHY